MKERRIGYAGRHTPACLDDGTVLGLTFILRDHEEAVPLAGILPFACVLGGLAGAGALARVDAKTAHHFPAGGGFGAVAGTAGQDQRGSADCD